jgi:hypothetical protein
MVFKSGPSLIHVFVPESYNPQKQYPLLLALHPNNNTGESFLPNLQLEAAKKQWIVACPDASNVDTWNTTDFQKDLNILKRTLRKLKNHFHLDPKKRYLLGDQTGGYFLLFLLTKEPIFLKDFMGIIVINTEVQSAFENKLWSTHIQKKELKPILYLQARDHTNAVYLRAQWTRDWFRNKGFPVRYVEESSFGGGYPFHLNLKIFDWCENEKSDGDEIKNDPTSIPMPLSKEFEILSFEKTSSDHKTGSSVQRSRVGISQTNYDAPSRVGNFSYSLSFQPKKTWEKNIKSTYHTVRVELKAFDVNKRLTFLQTTGYFGKDDHAVDIQKYKHKKYGILAKESPDQMEYFNTLQGGQTANVIFEVPRDRDQTFVAAIVYKDTVPVAFTMLPETANPADFPDLSGISVSKK